MVIFRVRLNKVISVRLKYNKRGKLLVFIRLLNAKINLVPCYRVNYQ